MSLELYVKSVGEHQLNLLNLKFSIISCLVMIPEFSGIGVDGPFMSADFKAESARDFYDCAATG